jgi:hypothetical protein
MKLRKYLLSLLLVLTLLVPTAFAGKRSGSSSGKVTHVRTYTKKNGTVVQAHDRTKPNKTDSDNWSTKGNVNPETGKKGTKPHKK